MPKVGIVIVNYNGEGVLSESIRSLYHMTEKDFSIVVVDNASKDKSIPMLRHEFSEVTVLEQDENLGFAEGNNIGFRQCEEWNVEYVLIINNDVEADPAMLTELLRASNGKRPAAPKIYYFGTNTIWSAGGELRWNRGSAVHYGIHEEDKEQYDEEKIVSFATGCCILIPFWIIRKHGMFDKDLFMYCEDMDLCARWQIAGVEPVYAPRAKLWHKISSSSGGEDSPLSTYYMFRNQFMFMNRYSKRLRFPAWPYAVLRALSRFLLSPVCKRNDRYILPALLDYCRGKKGKKEWS